MFVSEQLVSKKLFSKRLKVFGFLGLLSLLFLWTLAFADASLSSSNTLKVINFNVWGLPQPIVWDASFRFKHLMYEVENSGADVVLLNEVFSPKAKKMLHAPSYPYEAQGIRARGRLAGSGLRILSKYPITKIVKLGYGTCKKDDCLSRKGALLAVIELPSGMKVNVVNTHLNARGGDPTRQLQIQELEEFLKFYADPTAEILMAGDFNASPGSGTYQRVLNSWPVIDSWAKVNGMEGGYTYDTETNHYARDYAARTSFPNQTDRIDYQFVTSNLVPVRSEVIFKSPPLLSDHYGLLGEYLLTSPHPEQVSTAPSADGGK